MALSKEELDSIISAAIASPSADNSQPFKYKQINNAIELYIDEKRSGLASDNRFILSDIALGAIIENVVIRAQSLNKECHVTLLPNGEKEPYFVANIEISDDPKTNSTDLTYLNNSIADRCTDRRINIGGKISQKALDSLSQHNTPDTQVVIMQSAVKKSAIPVIKKAESIRFKSKQLHQELFSTVNFNDPNAKEGMPLRVLAIEKLAQPMFKLMSNWKWMSFLNKFGAANLLSIRSVQIPISLSPALLLISMKKNDRISVIEGGRVLQRVWLEATYQGISVQPYAAPGVFSLGFVNCEHQFETDIKTVQSMMKGVIQDKHALIFLRLDEYRPKASKTLRREKSSFAR